jgi:hypothetical protein
MAKDATAIGAKEQQSGFFGFRFVSRYLGKRKKIIKQSQQQP